MAVYRIRKDSLFLTELPMYGEKRLGVIKENRFLMKKPTQNGIATPVIVTASKPPVKTSIYPLGKKHYETTDWLGNVRVTYTDKKSWQQNKFALNVSSSQDYYPFGAVMEGRKYNLSAYRYAFNTQERIPELNESHYTALYWEYDGRLARRWNVDPKPMVFIGNYVVEYNNPIKWNDPLGDIVSGDEKGMNAFKLYRKEIKERIGKIREELSKVDHKSKKYIMLQNQLNAYNKINEELDKLEMDNENLYYIRTNVYFKDNKLSGKTYYFGVRNYEGKELKQINIDLSKSNFILPTLAHELKHAYQYYEGRLIFKEGSESGFDSKELEREAFERGWRFSGPTMYNNRRFNITFDVDIKNIELPSKYDQLPEKFPSINKQNEQQMKEFFKKHNIEIIYNIPQE
ncbi:MAG: hypothetical protein KatS3mg035_2180 [Bacteroidia bacterium]|nr:MAG: hypothetical protein KatS3mg035_2180 [Bacteroidia bacterium]